MRKNFMLSLAAMAALPMAGLADTVWELGTDPKVDWTPAGETTIQASTPQNILCVGTSISYTVTLPKGNYDLNWKALSNAKLTVAWGNYNKVYSESDNTESGYTTHNLVLSEETKVTLTLDAVNKGQFQISGLFFKLNFDFTTAYKKLVEKLGWYSEEEDGSYTYYANEGTTTLFQRIQSDLPDKIEGTTVNFENLKSTLLAKGRAQYDLFKGFKDVDVKDINAKDAAAEGKAAFELYKSLKLWKYDQEDATDIEKALAGIERVLAVYQNLDDIKTGIQTTLNGYVEKTDNVAGAYTKTVYQPVVDKFVQGINDELAKLEANYTYSTLPTDTYIEENFIDTKVNLTKSFELHAGIKQAFIDAENVYTVQTAAIADEKTAFDDKNDGYWTKGISAALYDRAIKALDREHTPVVNALSAFNSIILDLDNNAEASYKALVEFYKNENYVSDPYDVKGEKGGVLAAAKTQMEAVNKTYFTNEKSIAKQLQGEYVKVYGSKDGIQDIDGIQDTYNYVYAANEAYKDKFKEDIYYTDPEKKTGSMTSLLSDFNTKYLDNIAGSLEKSVEKIKADDILTIQYWQLQSDKKDEFKLEDITAEIKNLKDQIKDDTKVWADAYYELNTLLNGYQQTLNAFEKKLRAEVELSKFKGDNVNGDEALTLTQKGDVVYDAYKYWKDYAFEGKASLRGQLTAIATEIKGYAIKDLVKNSERNTEKFNEVKVRIKKVGDYVDLFDDVNTEESKTEGICAQRATRIAAILLSNLYEWKDKYAEKEAFVANKNVFVGNPKDNTTYGDLLATFNNGITALQQDVDAADKKNGSEHYTTLSNLLDKYWTIFDDPEATYTILAKTETDYTKDAQDKDNALAVKIAEVKSQITLCEANAQSLKTGLNTLKGKLEDTKAKDIYGKKLAELKGTAGIAGTDSYEGIMKSFSDLVNFDPTLSTIYKITASGITDIAKANEAEKTVKEDIQSVLSLTAALNALNDKAESVAAAVKLNETLRTRYISWCQTGTYKNDANEDVKVLDDGFVTQAKKILNTNIDGTKQADMQKAYDIIAEDVTALLKDLNKYWAEETLIDNASAIETRLGNILADINTLDTNVAKYNFNHSAHIWLNNYFANKLFVEVYDSDTQETKKIESAKNVYKELHIESATTPEQKAQQTAHKVFTAKAETLLASHNELKDEIETAYKEYSITEDKKNELKGKIDALKANIQKVTENCTANDTQYGELTKIYDDVDKAYNTVCGLPAPELQAKWKKAYDDKDIMHRIVNLKGGDKNVFEEKYPLEYHGYTHYYELGQFVDGTTDPYKHYKTLLDAVKKDKDDIDKIYDGSINDAVIASNKTLHANFLEQYDAAVRRYGQIVESLNEYMNSGANKEIVADAMNQLYPLRTQLDGIKTDEANAYWTIFNTNSSLKDGAEAVALPATHLKNLNDKKGDIEKMYLEKVTDFNTDAIAQFTEAFEAATKAVAKVVTLEYKDGKYVVKAAVKETAAAGYDPEAVAKAYSAITDMLTAERNEGYDVDNKTLTDGRLVYNLSSHLANLAEVTSLLTTAEQQLPVCQVQIWEVAMLDMDGKIQSLFKEYKSLATGEVDGTDYQTAFNDGFAAFKSAVAAGTPTADNIGSVKNAYTTTKDVYDAFTGMIGNKEQSEYYYEKFLAAIKGYGYDYESEDPETTTIQGHINNVVKHLRDFIKVEGKGMYACTTSIDKLENDLKTKVNSVALERGTYNFHIKYRDYNKLAGEFNALRIESINIDNNRTPVNEDELEFLKKQLTSLQAYLFSEIKDTDLYEKYSSEITAATASLPDPNKKEWKDVNGTRNTLLDCQNTVSKLRTRMTGFNAEEKQKELVAAVNTVGETYTSATEKIATLFDFQQETLKNLKAKDGAAAYKDSVTTDYKNGILVFNADTYAAEIEKAAKAMEVFALKVQAAVDAKTTHEETCDEIIGSFEGNGDFAKKFAELQAKMAGFDETVQEMFSWFIPYYQANAADRAKYYAGVKVEPKKDEHQKYVLLDATEWDKISFKKTMKSVNASVRAPQLNEENPFGNEDVQSFKKFFNYVDKVCSKAEVDVRIKNFAEAVKVLCDRDEETLTDYEGLKALIYAGIIKADPQYIVNYDELDKAVKAQYKLIDKAYTALYGVKLGVKKGDKKGYIDYAYEEQILSDIDGNPIKDEQGNDITISVKVNFVADCLQEIFDKIDELNATINKVVADTEANIYYRGDIDHDKVVDVNDFASLKLHILGYAEHQLEGMKLLAADTNADGKVNIGDLTRMVTMILNNERYAAPAREAANTGINDALAVMTEGEGVHQRIGIMLDAERVYAGCQMDILLPEGVTLVSESLGEMADGLSLSSNDLENGCHRVVLSSFDGAAMNTGNGAMLWLDVEVGHNYSGEGIELSNILFSNGAGRTFELSVASGETTGLSNVSMTQEVKEKIYNVGGILMDSLKRGVNIIRGNDGSSKKIVK